MHIKVHTLDKNARNTCIEVGRVIRMIRVTRVTFCLGQVGLILFMKYLGLTRIGSRDRTLYANSILLIKTTYFTTPIIRECV